MTQLHKSYCFSKPCDPEYNLPQLFIAYSFTNEFKGLEREQILLLSLDSLRADEILFVVIANQVEGEFETHFR